MRGMVQIGGFLGNSLRPARRFFRVGVWAEGAPGGLFWFAPWLCWALLSSGCGPSFEAEPGALGLPLADRDVLETGRQTGRWPGWRGTNGSGVAPGGRPPIRFSQRHGYRWRIPVPGRGNSSPVIWDQHVLLTSALEEADPPQLALLCFDRRDGRLRWQATVELLKSRTHPKNGYASATVATDGVRIFAFFGASGLACFDFKGRVLWEADLGPVDHQWGTASSPVLFDQSVIQLCDAAEDSSLVAYHMASGRLLWRTPRPSHGCWTTPVLVELEEGRQELVVNGGAEGENGQRMVVAYDPSEGSQLWQVRGTSDLVIPTVLVGNGLVYSLSGRNGPILAIRPGGRGDVTQTHVVWSYRRGGPYIPSGVVYRNRLYVVTDAGHLTSYNAGDGAVIWRHRLRGPFTASLIAADGRIYAANERGTVYVVAAADQFKLLAENALDEPCLATPAMADGELFIRTEGHLYCFPGPREAVAAGPGPSRLLRGS